MKPLRCSAAILAATTFLALVTGCKQYGYFSKQLPTFANMLIVAEVIQEEVEARGRVSDAEASVIIHKYFEDGDGWGNPLIFSSRTQPEFEFLLISTGSDGLLDVEEMEQYYQWAKEDVTGALERDLVFRNGKAVTIGSAK